MVQPFGCELAGISIKFFPLAQAGISGIGVSGRSTLETPCISIEI
jgi:hypothetical protein